MPETEAYGPSQVKISQIPIKLDENILYLSSLLGCSASMVGKSISHEANQLEMSLMVMIASLQVLALVAICTYIQLVITIQVLYEVTGSGVYQDFNYDIPNGNR